MTVAAIEKPRVRVPARSVLLATAGAMPVIQFRGIGAAGKKPEAEDDEAKEKEPVGKKAEDDEAKRAAEDDEEEDDEEDGKPAKKKAKAKRAKADDSTDDEDEEEDPDDDDESDRREAQAGPARAACLRERRRIAAILESPEASANLEFAVRLALTTDLPPKEAIGLLKAAPKAGRLADRMEGYRNLRPGAGEAAAPKGQAAIDALWDTQAKANGIIPR